MAFCSNCGTQIADGQKFCPNCGQPVAAPQQQYQPQQMAQLQQSQYKIAYQQPQYMEAYKKSSKKVWMWIGGILLSLIIIGAIGSVSSDDVEESVKQIMVDEMKKEYPNFKVKEIHLVEIDSKHYEGMATCTVNGKEYNIDVTATTDGRTVMAYWDQPW